MKKLLFILFILLTFVLNISAQKVEKLSTTEKNLRTHLAYLASDKLEGRKTGEKGATFAAGYVANMFARYKLKAGYINSSTEKSSPNFLQAFPFVSDVSLGKANVLSLSDTRTLTEAKIGHDWLPLKFSPNMKSSFSAIIFAGFGIEAKRLKYNDYRDIDVKNKIVLAFDGTPDKSNPHSQFGSYDVHAKANIAKKKGAKALILISSKQKLSDDDLPKRFSQTLGESAIPIILLSRETARKLLSVDELTLLHEAQFLETQVTGKDIKAPYKRIDRKKPLLAKFRIDLKKKETPNYNVIGVLEGTDAKLRSEAIIIGAHYDHLGRGGAGSLAPNSKEIHNGADDNASGTSALLELARQFSKSKNNKRTLIFIAFGAEESGLIGSKAYTANPVFPLEKTVAMINMDMVGRLDKGKLTVGGIGTASEWEKIVNEKQPVIIDEGIVGTQKISADNAENIPISVGINGDAIVTKKADKYLFNLQLNQDGFGPSDHSSFYAKKIPVLFFFTGTHMDYHKPSDDADKINYEGLEKITEFVSNIVKTIDQNPMRPTYEVAKSSSSMGGRTRFNVSLGTIPSYADSDNTGLVLDGVRDDSAADKAGIKGGDKIVKIGDKEVKNISDYMFMLGEMKAGDTYDLVVMRDGEKVMLKIVPDARK